jgi:hypothetical protein
MKVRLVAYRKVPTLVPGNPSGLVNIVPGTIVQIPLTFSSGDATDYYQTGLTLYTVGSTTIIGEITEVAAGSVTVICGQNLIGSYTLTPSNDLQIDRQVAFNLDLQDNPNVSLNFQFSDIKEPESRKASYSQTFKLPFTDANNDFFQNWYNVNLETLAFNTQEAFDAVLYVGTVPQFEGVIQLKSVYLKAGLYEVVLLSNGVNLFNIIGNQKIIDAWTDEEKKAWQFNYTYQNIGYSWDGGTTLFQNLDGVSFRDADANVQKVMFPMQVNQNINGGNSFIYTDPTNDDEKNFLRMDQSEITAKTNDGYDAQNYMTPIYQFKPAIQIRSVLKQIFFKSGYSYVSDFLDSDYFGRLFMTTCNHTGKPACEILVTPGMVSGQAIAGSTVQVATVTVPPNYSIDCVTNIVETAGSPSTTYANLLIEPVLLTINQTTPINVGDPYPIDTNGLWDTTLNAFYKTDWNMSAVTVRFDLTTFNIRSCWTGIEASVVTLFAVPTSATGVEDWANVNWLEWSAPWGITTADNTALFEQTIPIDNISLNSYVRFYVKIRHVEKNNNSVDGILNWCSQDVDSAAVGLKSKLTVVWDGFGDNVYDKVVDTINGIDPSLTQKAFLKDLIQRFNLVIIPDNDNPTILKIEPYNDFIGGGEQKFWSDKLDTSKEITIKDTTSLQKALINLTDAEDEDLMNKTIRENAPDLNVFGNINALNTNNHFAQGELKYQSIFSPYINQQVFSDNSEPLETYIPRMVVQYEFTYEMDGQIAVNSSTKTKPKLYYYSGSKTSLTASGDQYYLHSISTAYGGVTAHMFNDFPLCSPYELTAAGTNEATINVNTKSLYWSQQPPPAGISPVFNSDPDTNYLAANSLYYAYWSEFFNLIYNKDTKIVECFLNLNEVDIFNFKFNDEIFIKDKYYRILNISNYQVGAKASTKVTMITQEDSFTGTCMDCDYVLGTTTYSSGTTTNVFGGRFVWCPDTDPNCTPYLELNTDGSSFIGTQTSPECCECQGGGFFPVPPDLVISGETYFSQWIPGNGFCLANVGSLPIQFSNIYRVRNIVNQQGVRNYISLALGGYSKSLTTGTDRDKYAFNILPELGDDVKIKYNAKKGNVGAIRGESHRMVLIGKTTGSTKSYAYANGDKSMTPLYIPVNSITNIRVKGISTVVGGTSTSYPLGSTEAFAYYTAFKNVSGVGIVQLGTANGTPEYSLKESGVISTCTLEIDTFDGAVRFGIKDTDANAIRVWQITADYDVSMVPNVEFRIDQNDAQYQNYDFIQFQNLKRLQWN